MKSAEGCSVESIAERIAPLRKQLARHRLYERIRTPDQLCRFMESHVFAVWDFMSLLKALQARLTCVAAPWTPTPWPESRRFINEIVLGEESDRFEGRAVSHFELYLEAMREAGADTGPIDSLLLSLPEASALAAGAVSAPEPARQFAASTFRLIESGQVHRMAAAFTFGREDLIPAIFRSLVRDLNGQFEGRYGKLVWYLERHIEVDGEDHGPLSLRMVADLCGDDEARWEEAACAAEESLEARLALWDGIAAQL